MKVKKTLFWGGMLMSAALAFSSCDKELDSENNNYQTNGNEDDYLVPFFEVAKGDSISKDIYRAKPHSEEEGSNEIVFSDDENNSAALRALSTGTANLRYIIGVQARSFNSAAEAPSWYRSIPHGRGELYDYYKLNFDLNAGAGGKFIYFYYCPEQLGSTEEYNVRIRSNSMLRELASMSEKKKGHYAAQLASLYNHIYGYNFQWHEEGTNGCKGQNTAVENLYLGWSNYYLGTGEQVDLNEGAGGRYVYIFGSHNNYLRGAIKAIAISEKKSVSGYRLVSCDLNDGAGGKYIYLHAKNQ